MSVLLLSPTREVGVPLVQRLVAQDDEVRVIEIDSDLRAIWKELGAFVATGSATDVDLIERAGQNVRTMVLLETSAGRVEAALEGARLAGIGRLVVCAPDLDGDTTAALRASETEYVALITRARRRFLRPDRTAPAEAIAEAIDAADDLPGPQRLELNLTDPSAWGALGLTSPPSG